MDTKYLSKCGGLFPQDGYLPFELYVRSPKPPSCSESARDSLTASGSSRANTIHGGNGGGGLSLSGRQVPKRSGGLFPQDGSLPFKLSVTSPNPPSYLDSAHASLTTSASASTSHRDSSGGGVSPSGHRFPKQSGGLFPLIGFLPSERSKKLGGFQNTPSGNVICPVVGGGDSMSSPSYSDSEIDVVHTAFSVTTATHDSGGRKGGDQPPVSSPVGGKRDKSIHSHQVRFIFTLSL